MCHRDGVVRLSSSDGTLFEIVEEKLSRHDLTYLRSQDVYKNAYPKVIFWPFCFPPNLLIYLEQNDRRGPNSTILRAAAPRHPIGFKDSTNTKRLGLFRRFINRIRNR